MGKEEEEKNGKEYLTLYEIFVRQEIELGLLDSLNGITETVDVVRKEFGLETVDEKQN